MNRLILLSRNGFVALLLCMLAVSFSTQAQHAAFTPAEIASLPQYCQDKMNGNRNQQRWDSYFGAGNWLHFHHYCYGLIWFSRASMSYDELEMRRNAGLAIADFDYVLRNWPASFPFYQKAQMYKSQLEIIAN